MENFKILDEKENSLFGRKEISFTLTSGSAPSRIETVKFIAEKLSTKPENLKIKSVDGKFGSHEFHGRVFVYESEEKKDSIEGKKKKDDAVKEALKPKPVEDDKPEESNGSEKPESSKEESEDKSENDKQDESKEESSEGKEEVKEESKESTENKEVKEESK